MRLSHELELSRDVEQQARQDSDRLQEDLKAEAKLREQIKAEHTAEVRRLKAELKVKEQAVVQKPETREVGEQADDRKTEKSEIFQLKTKLKVAELEKRQAENQRDEFRERLEASGGDPFEMDDLKRQVEAKDTEIQKLKEDLLQKKKQMAADRRNIKQLEKQLANGRLFFTKLESPQRKASKRRSLKA